jgi:heavy metal efflux system protein
LVARVLRAAIEHPVTTVILTALLAGAGIWSLSRLPIDAFPDVTNIQVQVLTAAPALAPVEVERQITFPIEVAMSGLPRLEEIRSVSRFGLSAITVVFDDDVDIYFARQLVFQRLQQARSELPADLTPEMGPISTGLGEIYQYEIRSTAHLPDLMELRTVQDWIVRRQLLSVPGVTEVNSFGGFEKRYEVRLSPAHLRAYGIAPREVWEAIERNNQNAGGAYIEHGSEQYLLRGVGLVTGLEDLRNIVVKTAAGGVPVYIRDLAEVAIGSAIRPGATTADGQGEIVAGIAMMLKGENSRAVAQRVRARIEEIRRTLPPGTALVPFYDRTELVQRTIHTVRNNLVEGAVLVIVVLVLLLGSWRGALLVASVIPLSMMGAAVFMLLFGVSGNLMSLGAIDFGLIVDGAVVMVENAVRRRGHARSWSSNDLLTASSEVGRPVVFAVGIIILVYLPILTLTGIEGKMFRPMALTVVFALVTSLVLSLTYVPAALGYLLRRPAAENETRLMAAARPVYRWALERTMRHRRLAVTVAALLFVAAAVLFRFLGSEFIPRLDEGSIAIESRLLPSVSLAQAIRTYSQAEQALRRFPEVTHVVTKIGTAEVATDPMGVNSADIFVDLKPRRQWRTAHTRERLVYEMSEALERQVPVGSFSFSQPIEMRTSELIAGVRADIAVKVFGDDLSVLRRIADRVARVLGRVRGATDVRVEQVAGLPQLQVRPDRAALARYGLGIADVNAVVQSLVAGRETGRVQEGERSFALVVKLAEPVVDIQDIQGILLTSPSGARIPLGQLASVEVTEGPAQISREEAHRRVAIELNVRDRDIGSFVRDAQRAIAREIDLPPGYYIRWGGQFENLQRASRRLAIVIPLALALIFATLVATVGSVRQALLIYTGIPFAVVGGVFALAARGMPFSISAGVGFIALAGVAVMNGVVLVSYIIDQQKLGLSPAEAALKGGLDRMRAMIMAPLVAALGFVPMAISTSAGAEVQRPLATVVIGGLITSTALTLLLLPTLYVWFTGDRGPERSSVGSSQPD